MTPEIQAQLENLRDIRLPDPIGWWPLAPGWWMLLALVCAAVLGTLIWNTLRKRTARYLALRELEQLDAADPGFAANLSILLRRVAIRKDRAAGQLKDADWVAFLTGHGMQPALAEHLAAAPYAKTLAAQDAGELRASAATWIRSQT